jgi:Txe/YoeB family toxin of toxin-antitoxin system
VYRIAYTKQAAKDIKNLKAAGLSIKAKELIEIIRNDPFKNPPPYEGLVGNLDGFYSRRINQPHRKIRPSYDTNR